MSPGPTPYQPIPGVALAIHGGAGTIRRENLTPEIEAACHRALESALRAGHGILTSGGGALDAVEAAVRFLEDEPLFNAGRGAVFTAEGHNELDAAVMDGATGKAGAVAGVTTVRNPVTLARAVLERTPFVFLAGRGAEQLAADLGMECVDPPYFWTEARWKQLQEAQRRERENPSDPGAAVSLSEDNKFGTVGAVAVDEGGNLAAATSTGGMTNKRYGRVGDSPVIGAGTWADNTTCAVSATGHGEYFLRLAVAHDIAARVAYAGASVAEAAGAVVHEKLRAAGGDGGVIALDARGNAALPFNTSGMYRGYVTRSGEVRTAIYAD
ncbi:MAG TPA: isoaspartyl peptidase/L-asparaginase [Armatimonadaceae bacterium]|nr:isoaspartyl peptidase/L-asparaginase [Armatimonadaceae bacterium]